METAPAPILSLSSLVCILPLQLQTVRVPRGALRAGLGVAGEGGVGAGAGEQETAAAREKCVGDGTGLANGAANQSASTSLRGSVVRSALQGHPSPHLQSRCKFSATRRFGSAAADKTRREEPAAAAAAEWATAKFHSDQEHTKPNVV